MLINIRVQTADIRRKNNQNSKPHYLMWLNPFNNFYQKGNPQLEVSSLVKKINSKSKSSKGLRIRNKRMSNQTTRINTRPCSGYVTNATAMSSNTYKMNLKVNNLANYKGFREANSKYDSFVNNQGSPEVIFQNIDAQEFDQKQRKLELEDNIAKIAYATQKPQSLIQKITESDTKALVDYTISKK
jgi:flagellar basal body rod protein FlgC